MNRIKINKYLKLISVKEFSTLAPIPQIIELREQKNVIISCRNKKLNFNGNKYNKLDDIPLASKGWFNNKSSGDNFTIKANIEDYDKPKIKFEDVNISPKLINVLKEQDINFLTTYQSEAIPVVKSGKPTLLAAETGCGKTIAYLVPIIENLTDVKPKGFNMPNALILVPNRELAHQIGGVAKVLGNTVNLNVKIVTGGRTKKLMLNPEFSDVDILVATPGAISKLSTVGVYKLQNVMYTVFDEADTLLDNSFLDKIQILTNRVSQSQFIFASATLPKKFPDVFEPILQNLVHVKSPRLHRPLLNIQQKFLRLLRSNRPAHLLEIAKTAKSPLLVFSNRNATCDWISMFLREHGIQCANINGSMHYNIRIEQWQQFISGSVNVLSATDVGSRGLDTTQVKHLINYDFPLYASDYIHRVGRVGRLGSVVNSRVFNFVSGPGEVKLVQQIEYAIRTGSEIPNVDANINAIIQNKILKSMREHG